MGKRHTKKPSRHVGFQRTRRPRRFGAVSSEIGLDASWLAPPSAFGLPPTPQRAQ
jgi:hypothetical protein